MDNFDSLWLGYDSVFGGKFYLVENSGFEKIGQILNVENSAGASSSALLFYYVR